VFFFRVPVFPKTNSCNPVTRSVTSEAATEKRTCCNVLHDQAYLAFRGYDKWVASMGWMNTGRGKPKHCDLSMSACHSVRQKCRTACARNRRLLYETRHSPSVSWICFVLFVVYLTTLSSWDYSLQSRSFMKHFQNPICFHIVHGRKSIFVCCRSAPHNLRTSRTSACSSHKANFLCIINHN
jgi:hypothetical protein